jgi:hypothetical protein
MAFNDCFLVDGGALSIPRWKLETMVENGQLERVDDEHLVRVHERKTGAFRVGVEVLDWKGWLKLTTKEDRVELQPVKAQEFTQFTTPPEAGRDAHNVRPDDAAALPQPQVATPAVSVTHHARDRWRERVTPFLRDVATSKAAILSTMARAVPVNNPSEHRPNVTYYRLLTPGQETGWIEFVIADQDTPLARIITIETERSHAEAFPETSRRKLSADRRARALGLHILPSSTTEHWTVQDPDGRTWTVQRGTDTIYPYACSCPDFTFKAGRARISCKHIWAVRESVGDTADDAI